MSHLQYGTLKYLFTHRVSVESLRGYNLTTLGSLVQRGWVERRGNAITLTDKGVDAYNSYHQGGPNYRQHEGDLSERVRLMLHIRALNIAKGAA